MQLKKWGYLAGFLSCSAVIRENDQKNLSFSKNYECYENLSLVCFPGLYIISGLQIQCRLSVLFTLYKYCNFYCLLSNITIYDCVTDEFNRHEK